MAEENKAQTNPTQTNPQQAAKPAEAKTEPVAAESLEPGHEGTFPAAAGASDGRASFKDLADGTRVYKLQRGKHIYRDESGEVKTAGPGDYIALTPAQLESMGDRIISE